MRALLLLIIPSLILAEGGTITVKDTSGFVRAEENISSQFGSIEFSVLNETGEAAEGAIVTITNEATGEIIQTTAENGVALFQNLLPGTYIVSSSEMGLTFTTVAISGGSTGITILPALAGVAIAGGATVGIVELTDDDDDKTVISPSS